MSSRARGYVGPGAEMFSAVGYDVDGNAINWAGPYSTRGPAMAARNSLLSRRVVRVRVETCRPGWEPVQGTEIVRWKRTS